MDKDSTIFVGLDVHKESIAVAIAPGAGGEPRSLGRIPNRPERVAALVRKLGTPAQLVCAYEAGPCGYVLYRQLTGLGVRCVVVAPSLIPSRPGERVKTDRRDALKLARLLRSGDLAAVWVPDAAHEALRDLTRAREDAQQDLLRTRHRLVKLLLRQGVTTPTGVKPWTQRYLAWLETLRLPQASSQVALREYRLAITQAQERLARLDQDIAEAATTSAQAPVIAALRGLRGIDTVSATSLVAELGDLTRFATPRQLMGYVGVVSREDSSGGRVRRGAITKTGNAHVRHVVVESTWHYRHPPKVGAVLRRRQVGLSEEVKTISYQAQDRLHRRYRRLLGKGKAPQQAVVAAARELLGFLWAIGQQVARERAAAPAPSLAA